MLGLVGDICGLHEHSGGVAFVRSLYRTFQWKRRGFPSPSSKPGHGCPRSSADHGRPADAAGPPLRAGNPPMAGVAPSTLPSRRWQGRGGAHHVNEISGRGNGHRALLQGVATKGAAAHLRSALQDLTRWTNGDRTPGQERRARPDVAAVLVAQGNPAEAGSPPGKTVDSGTGEY